MKGPEAKAIPDVEALPELLEARGIRKRYADGSKSRYVLDGVDLTLARGQWLALVGPSGSGKSTLVSILGGLTTPTEGDVRILGRSIVHMRDHHRALYRRHHVGFVFQDLALIPRMTLLENVLLPLAPAGRLGRDSANEARALLERLSLLERADRPTEQLSGGERQRGCIARALILDPAILLMDEPTAHVDADQVEGLLALLDELRAEGRAILTSTHDPRLAEDSRVGGVIRIEDGSLVP